MGGTGEETPTSKPSKPPASAQELPATPAYPDWSSPNMQAYYGAGAAPPFYAASPTPHPYLWSGQHAMIPPYGTPIPYPQMYPAGGVYAHPSMAVAPSPAQPMKASHNASDGKNGTSSKKKRGASGNEGSAGTTKGVVDAVKATSASGNDAASQSAESGSEGSSDANEDGQQEYGARKHVVSGAATNPNIGMDLWNANSKMRPAGASAAMVPGAQWNHQHDDREVKRQRRKQSNRESARRSRLRKQAECEELQVRVESLTNENLTLKDELLRLSEECQKLTSENSSIKEELTRNCGIEADS